MKFFVQKSFLKKDEKKLFLVPTPIGNLKEFPERSIEILENSSLLICENKFSCLRILSHFKIKKKKILVYNNISEKSEYMVSKVFNEMIEHDSISMISCAGYPLVSDPGRLIVRKWIDMGFYVIPVSGSSAFLNALVSSGFYFHNFVFLGFLPRSQKKQIKILDQYKNVNLAIIIYESPLRVLKTLKGVKDSLGNRLIAVCREITKINEEFIRGSVEEISFFIENNVSEIRGEVVIVISIEEKKNKESNFVQKVLYAKKNRKKSLEQ